MPEKGIRLDKYLADRQAKTRSEAKTLIQKCHVSVNEEIIKDPKYKVFPEDKVALDGVLLAFTEKKYIVMNKPAGVLSAAADKHQKTVLDLLPETQRKGLFPAGRLDKDAEGLLFITNDGILAHKLLSPKSHVDKVYYAKVCGRVTQREAALFAMGLKVDEEFTAMPAKLDILSSGEISEIELTIREGKFHQVKRMFEVVGMKVLYLKRIQMGSLVLPSELLPGGSRYLTEEEIKELEIYVEKTRAETKVGQTKQTEQAGQTGQTKPENLLEIMLNGIEAVIFDLDGTLVDSMWMWKQIDIEYLGRFHIPLPDGLQSSIEGMSFSETANYFKKNFPEITDSIDQMKENWNKMAWDKYVNEVPLKPGVLSFLKLLQQRQIKTGIATSNSTELVHAVLGSLGVENYFNAVHTACEAGAGKPAPDIYILVAEKLETAPERCLVFEDIIKGIQAGKNAGMKVCAVRDDYSMEKEEEKKALADYFIDSYLSLQPK